MDDWQLRHEPDYDAMYEAYCKDHDEWFYAGHNDAMNQVYDPPRGGQEREWYLDGVRYAYEIQYPLPNDNTDILF